MENDPKELVNRLTKCQKLLKRSQHKIHSVCNPHQLTEWITTLEKIVCQLTGSIDKASSQINKISEEQTLPAGDDISMDKGEEAADAAAEKKKRKRERVMESVRKRSKKTRCFSQVCPQVYPDAPQNLLFCERYPKRHEFYQNLAQLSIDEKVNKTMQKGYKVGEVLRGEKKAAGSDFRYTMTFDALAAANYTRSFEAVVIVDSSGRKTVVSCKKVNI